MNSPELTATVNFLRGIGLTVIESDDAKGFLENVRIDAGVLYYRPGVTSAANLLHEAGHVAIIPARYRQFASDCIEELIIKMCDEMGERQASDPHFDPDSPENCAIMQAGETEATAWAFAAGRAIGLPDHLIIEDQDYDGEGEGVRFALAMNSHFGINGLRRGGMCQSVKTYPALTKWLQD